MFNKKSQSMSINVIIVAAIALAVLVILFAIFTGRMSIFKSNTDKTEAAGYACICSAPNSGRICAAVDPDGTGTKIKVDPVVQCGGSWTDCALTCWG